MATVSRENIGQLTDKLVVKVAKEDYLPSFEASLKKHAKSANLAGFRKGMVPASLVKKMYGQGVFADEILRMVEKELNDYMAKEQLDIFAQPLPLENDSRMLDMNNPSDYAFAFEIGLKPSFDLDISNIKVTRYVVEVTIEMIDAEVERLRTRHGNMTEPETVRSDDHVLNLNFAECDKDGNIIEDGIGKDNSLLVKYFEEDTRKKLAGLKKDDSLVIQLSTAFAEKEREWLLGDLGLDKENPADAEKYFKITITKVGFVEKAAMEEPFFETAYPGRSIKTEEEFRNAVKVDIETYFQQQSSNQVQDQIFHHLTDHTHMDFPESFLKRWLKEGSEKSKTEDEAEQEFPSFASQLKWSLISTKLINDNRITVEAAEIKNFALQQIAGYMGIQTFGEAPWLDEYANRMMKDRKFTEETYMKIQTSKLFSMLERQVQATEETITAEALAEKMHHHH